MKNKTFRSSEQAIFWAYFKLRDYPNAKKLSERAKISRQTFYNHHYSPQRIPYDYEIYLLKLFKKRMKTFLIGQKFELRMIFLRMLIFIYNNREVIGILLKDGRKNIIDEMMLCLKPRIMREWRYSGQLEDMYTVYAKEVSGVIENWAREEFDEKKLEETLGDIMFLTRTSARRLAGLIK